MEPYETKMQEEHLKYKHLIDEQFAKMLLANKIIDDKVKTSDEPRYVEMRGYVAATDKINEFASRKFAYFYEMDNLGGNWKVNWEDEICAYYKNLPYHDEVNIYLDGKHTFIPKKMYDIEGLNKKLQEKGLDPVLLDFMAAQKLNDAAHTNEHTNASS